MVTISVPIPRHLERFIKGMVRQGAASSKADVVRRALIKFAEDEAVEAVLRAMREAKDGKILRGDLDELAARMP